MPETEVIKVMPLLAYSGLPETEVINVIGTCVVKANITITISTDLVGCHIPTGILFYVFPCVICLSNVEIVWRRGLGRVLCSV